MPTVMGALFLLILAASQAAGQPTMAPGGAPRTHSVAVLELVDLGFQTNRPITADYLRKGLRRANRWSIMAGDTLSARLKGVGMDPERPCKEFQCAFDEGSALQVEYILFGTMASLREMQAYTLTLLHVPSAQVVWSRAGDIPRKDGERPLEALESALAWAVEGLDPIQFDLRKVPSLGLMAVVDAGDLTPHARVVRERAMAHVYASRNYDLIAQEELEDLLRALDIAPPAEGTPEEEILDIGRKMDVRYVLTSRLTELHGRYRLQLSLHDLSGGKAVRKWPTKDAPEFAKLLRIEDRFFSTLGDPDLPAGPAIPRPSPVRTIAKYTSVVVAMAAGAGLGYMSYDSNRRADGQFQRFQSASSEEEALAAKNQVQQKDVQTKRYGILSGVCLLVGVAVWTF